MVTGRPGQNPADLGHVDAGHADDPAADFADAGHAAPDGAVGRRRRGRRVTYTLDVSRSETGSDVLPGYRVTDRAGAGAAGQVWRAVEEATGHPVAIKVLRPGQATDDVQREAAVLTKLRHPHVVRLRRSLTTGDGRLALVLDEVAGPSLAALVAARGPLEPGEVVTMLTPLAQALAHAHARSVVHGDLSSANIVFDGDGRPLIVDLGVGSLLGWEPAQGATEGFADPMTTLLGRHEPAGDLYSLAAAGWFALTGSAPQGPGLRPPLLTVAPEVPLALAELLESAMSGEPASRPSAHDFAVAAYASAPVMPVRVVDTASAPATALTSRLRRVAEPVEAQPGPRRRRWPGWIRRARRRDAGHSAGPVTGTGRAPDRGRRGRARPAGERAGRRRARPLLLTLVVGGFLVGGVLAGVPGLDGIGLDSIGLGRLSADGGPVASHGSPASPDPAGAAPARQGAEESASGAAGDQAAAGDLPADEATSALLAEQAGTDPVAAVSAISELRAIALASGSQELLHSVDAPDSPALQADRALLAALAERDELLQGLSFKVADPRVLSVGTSGADVQVVVSTSAHTVVRASDGTVLREVPAGAGRAVVIRLSRIDDRWLVSSIADPPS